MVESNKKITCGKLCIYLESRSVYINEKEILLTRMEFDVLFFLASNPNIAFTKEQIYEAVSVKCYNKVVTGMVNEI